jgi:hypothetical protein
MDFGGEPKAKEPRRVHTNFPPSNPQEKGPENTQRKTTKRELRKSPPRTTGNNTTKP